MTSIRFHIETEKRGTRWYSFLSRVAGKELLSLRPGCETQQEAVADLVTAALFVLETAETMLPDITFENHPLGNIGVVYKKKYVGHIENDGTGTWEAWLVDKDYKHIPSTRKRYHKLEVAKAAMKIAFATRLQEGLHGK